MRVAIITPPRLLHLAEATTFHLGLVQLVRADTWYTTWHKRRTSGGCYVILDNGAAEGEIPPSPPTLLRMADRIGAQEVVAPDALCKAKDTYNLTATFMASRQTANFVPEQIMLVPQGEDYTEWLDCFQRMRSRWSGPEYIYGISRAVERLWTTPMNRADLVNRLVRQNHLRAGEQVHLLGVGNSLQGIRDLSRSAWVRSIDTSLPIVAAQCGYELSAVRDRKLAELRYDPFESRIDEALARYNIETFRRWCSDED